jgi:hypothetical protein
MLLKHAQDLMNLAIVKRYGLTQARLLSKFVGIPLVSVAALSLILLYAIGGDELVPFTVARLFTWAGLRRVLIVVIGVTLLTWVRHITWYSDEPPPMWLRGSLWLNLLEVVILLAVIGIGVWAFSRFAPPPLPSR